MDHRIRNIKTMIQGWQTSQTVQRLVEGWRKLWLRQRPTNVFGSTTACFPVSVDELRRHYENCSATSWKTSRPTELSEHCCRLREDVLTPCVPACSGGYRQPVLCASEEAFSYSSRKHLHHHHHYRLLIPCRWIHCRSLPQTLRAAMTTTYWVN